MEFWVLGDAGLSSVGILILESHNFWLTVSPWSAQFSKSSYWWLSFISLFWTSSFLIFVTHLVHDGSSGFVLSQDFPLTVAICFALLILHGSNLQEKIYNRLRASWGLLLRLQLQSNQLEGKRESSSYTTQGSPSSWGNWVSLRTERRICCWRQHFKSLTWLCTTSCWMKYGSCMPAVSWDFSYEWIHSFCFSDWLRCEDANIRFMKPTRCVRILLGVLYIQFYLMMAIALWGTCCPHFIDDEAETQSGVNNWLHFIELASG